MDTFETYVARAEQAFMGWDFSAISRADRMVTQPLPWSYGSKVLQYQGSATAMLDLGTGGGEVLSLFQPFPPLISATEGYAPHVLVAQQRLEPLGVSVVAVGDDDQLPFPNAQFDLVIDSHESYEAYDSSRPVGLISCRAWQSLGPMLSGRQRGAGHRASAAIALPLMVSLRLPVTMRLRRSTTVRCAVLP